MFREPIESVDRVMMFKIMILQRYYNLSNEQTEFHIKDRLSFMDFPGLSFGDNVPDENSIRNFREDLAAHNLFETLFSLFMGQVTHECAGFRTTEDLPHIRSRCNLLVLLEWVLCLACDSFLSENFKCIIVWPNCHWCKYKVRVRPLPDRFVHYSDNLHDLCHI